MWQSAEASIIPDRREAGSGGEKIEPRHRATTMRSQYLHLSAYPCERCEGRSLVDALVRESDISKESGIRQIGAICLSCSHKHVAGVRSFTRKFPPVDWESNWGSNLLRLRDVLRWTAPHTTEERVTPDHLRLSRLGANGKTIWERDRNRLFVPTDLRWKAAYKMNHYLPSRLRELHV